MLPPSYLDQMPDAFVQLWQQVEEQILQDVARRIGKMDKVTATANWQLWRYQQTEALRNDVVKLLAKCTGKSETAIRKLLLQAATEAMEREDAIYYHYGMEPTPFEESAALNNLLDAGARQTCGTWQNITATTANTVTGAFERTLDAAWLKVSTGAFDYKAAVKQAVDSLADDMPMVTYPSGHKDSIEVAARRAVLTGVNQTTGKLQVARMDEMGCEFVETTAHGGARPSHAEWQGRRFHRGGAVDYKGRHYPDFEAATGYGTGAGLCGWNCRHTFFAVFPELGDPPQWTQEQLRELNARDIEWNGKKYTAYEISQMQRARERNVRRWKKRYLAEDAAGLDTTDSAVRLRAARQSLAEFAQATGGRVDSARVSVPKFGRSEASKASAKSQAHHTDWLKSINAQSTSLNTVAKYYDARYNNTEEYRLLMQYANSVKSGWLSPLAGFDLYKSTYERIQTELVGKTTADGTVITGHTAHFMERMFGTLVDPDKLKYDLKIIRRSGVGYEAMRDTVLNPERINPVKTDSRGKRSVRLIGKAIVTINPDTGQLIQLNPRSEQK
jgi:hypothetical protein|nr:MAG TPA: minor capsid protein [Caudoviricetes sp.]